MIFIHRCERGVHPDGNCACESDTYRVDSIYRLSCGCVGGCLGHVSPPAVSASSVSDEEIVRQVGAYFFAPEDMDAKVAVVRAVRSRLAASPAIPAEVIAMTKDAVMERQRSILLVERQIERGLKNREGILADLQRELHELKSWLASVAPTKETTESPTAPPTATEEGD